jgi:C-terminal processing protease CtpA/Prc
MLLVAALVAVSGPLARAADPPLSPAMQAYDAVSVYRDRNSDTLWDDRDASQARLAAVRDDLLTGLRALDEPQVSGLAEGNLYLRFRRYNFLGDLVKVDARLGDRDAAFDAWRAMGAMAWVPDQVDRYAKDPDVGALMEDPRLKPLLAQQHAVERWGRAPALATPYHDTLDEAQRIAGLSMVWSNVRDGFVWFDHVPDLDWDRAYLDAIPEVLAAQSTENYYRVLMRLMARLHDGHSNVYPPKALEDRFYSRPGIGTARVEDRVLVTRISDDALAKAGLRVGDEIVAIDGRPVEAYAEAEVAPYQSSSTPQDLSVRTYDYALLAGPAERKVRLSLQRADGSTYALDAPRSGYRNVAATPTPYFTLRADGIAVLDTRQFEDDGALKAFEAHLDQIMSAKGLVIDLRGNGGGSSSHGLDILAWLSRDAIPTTTSRYRENTAYDRARSEHPQIEWRSIEGGRYQRPHDRVFGAPVVMLIDARTFSAAEDTAAAFKAMKRGPIIGTPSGGSTGQPLFFDLPGGGSARVCVKRDTYADGSDFVGRGVQPDVVVPVQVDDVRRGRDAAMEQAVTTLLPAD